MDAKRIYFNSSLPRSGSTLLQNILGQNPRFYVSPTSGLMELLYVSRIQFSGLAEFKAQDPALMRSAFMGYCRGALNGFYEELTDKPVCIDKNRSWFHYYNWLKMFYPNPKILICIRDLRAVISSMEKLFRANRHIADPLDNWERMNMVTLSARIGTWLTGPPVGIAVGRLVEAIETNTLANFHVVRFEDLTSDPKAVLQKVYAYLEEPWFEHDFDHVPQVTREQDGEYGIYGDHRIREKVAPVTLDYNQVLGKEHAEFIKNHNRIFYSKFYPER